MRGAFVIFLVSLIFGLPALAAPHAARIFAHTLPAPVRTHAMPEAQLAVHAVFARSPVAQAVPFVPPPFEQALNGAGRGAVDLVTGVEDNVLVQKANAMLQAHPPGPLKLLNALGFQL